VFSAHTALLTRPLFCSQVITVLIDIYVTHLERGEARRQLLCAALPGEATFLDMARGSRSSGAADACSTRVTWGHYLEYRLRKMTGTEVHPALLDELKAHFAALDRHGKGYIEWHDLESAMLARRASSQPAGLRASDIQEMGTAREAAEPERARPSLHRRHPSGLVPTPPHRAAGLLLRKRSYEARGTLPSASSMSSLPRPSSCGDRSAQRSSLPTTTVEEEHEQWEAARCDG